MIDASNQQLTPVRIGYDQTAFTDSSGSGGLAQHDPGYNTNFPYRGNPTTLSIGPNLSSLNGTQDAKLYYAYDLGGVVTQVTDGAGKIVTTSPSAATNYSLPRVLTPNGTTQLQTSISYAASFAVQQLTGPNNVTTQIHYDAWGRPDWSMIPDGATTFYT